MYKPHQIHVAREKEKRWKRDDYTTDDLLEELAADLSASVNKIQKIEIEPAPKVSSILRQEYIFSLA